MNFIKIISVCAGILFLILMSSCSNSMAESPEKIVESYIKALVNKDEATLSNLSCKDWELNALMELDSLQAVEVILVDLACNNIGNENEYTLVSCTGFMVATYNGENQEIDLSVRNYLVINTNNGFLVCGYK